MYNKISIQAVKSRQQQRKSTPHKNFILFQSNSCVGCVVVEQSKFKVRCVHQQTKKIKLVEKEESDVISKGLEEEEETEVIKGGGGETSASSRRLLLTNKQSICVCVKKVFE